MESGCLMRWHRRRKKISALDKYSGRSVEDEGGCGGCGNAALPSEDYVARKLREKKERGQ